MALTVLTQLQLRLVEKVAVVGQLVVCKMLVAAGLGHGGDKRFLISHCLGRELHIAGRADGSAAGGKLSGDSTGRDAGEGVSMRAY